MSKDIQCSLFHGVAKLNQPRLMAWIVYQEDNLRPPEFDVFRLDPQEVFSYLMVNQALADVSPVFWWRQVMQ